MSPSDALLFNIIFTIGEADGQPCVTGTRLQLAGLPQNASASQSEHTQSSVSVHAGLAGSQPSQTQSLATGSLHVTGLSMQVKPPPGSGGHTQMKSA